MARAKNSENLSPVTGSITLELREALENYRWPARKTMSEAVREGLEFWAKDKGIWSPEGETEAEGDPDLTPEQIAELEAKEKADSEAAAKEKADAEAAKAEADKLAADKVKTSSSRATK